MQACKEIDGCANSEGHERWGFLEVLQQSGWNMINLLFPNKTWEKSSLDYKKEMMPITSMHATSDIICKQQIRRQDTWIAQ